MKERDFAKLLAIRSQLISDGTYSEEQIAYPFAPHVGRHYGKDDLFPRLMLIGKATHGSYGAENESKPTFEDQMQGTDEIAYSVSSAFWRFLVDFSRMIATHVHIDSESERIDRAWIMDRIIWNNAMKLGAAPKGNPTGKLAEAQRLLCKEILIQETEEHDPKFILVVTAGYELKLIENVYGAQDTWKDYADIQMWAKVDKSGRYIFATMHPMIKTSYELAHWLSCMREFISAN